VPKTAAPTTLAVLPLQVLTEKEKIGYLGVGISDAIITRLANISQLRVRPTSSILRYKDQPADVQEAGKTLNAENVLSGTLQQVGSRLRVSVQLIRISDGAPLWGHQYDLAQQDLLSLQDQLADRVTTALKIQATAAERERVYRRYTQNAEAYDFYLRGRAHLALSESARAAVDSFQRALQIDSNYALAHAGLAFASGLMYNSVAADAERKQWGERAEQEARAALAIAPDLAEAHEALAAYYQLTEFKWDRTIEESRRALELNPALDRPHFILAGTYLHVGFLDLVEPEMRAANELNPGGVLSKVASMTGVAALWGARFAEAVPLLEQARREVGPFVLLDWNLGNAYFYVGKRQQAEQLLAGVKRGNEPDIRAQAALASFLAARGERKRAEEILKQVMARPSFEHHAMYSAGATYAQLGRPAEAVRMLRQARDTGFFCYPWYERDPLLRPLERDPEFQKFMQEFRQQWEAFRARYAVGP
jgi:TolB-like protein